MRATPDSLRSPPPAANSMNVKPYSALCFVLTFCELIAAASAICSGHAIAVGTMHLGSALLQWSHAQACRRSCCHIIVLLSILLKAEHIAATIAGGTHLHLQCAHVGRHALLQWSRPAPSSGARAEGNIIRTARIDAAVAVSSSSHVL